MYSTKQKQRNVSYPNAAKQQGFPDRAEIVSRLRSIAAETPDNFQHDKFQQELKTHNQLRYAFSSQGYKRNLRFFTGWVYILYCNDLLGIELVRFQTQISDPK
jgi:hypothetical protein